MTSILRELFGLFVDDEFLAVAILAVVAAAAGLALVADAEPLVSGAVLFGGCIAVLALGVWRTAHVRRRP